MNLTFLETIKEKRSKKVNKIEQIKIQLDPKTAYQRLLEASQKGYNSLTAEDKKVFLKYFGLFDKNEFTPGRFMLRVRIPGGKLTPLQALTLGEVAKEFGKDYIDLTTRMQIELRNIKIEDVPAIFEKLKKVGITTYQTGIDNIRNILVDPLDGLAKDNFFESSPLLKQLEEIFLFKDEWVGTLPRKFNTALSSSVSNRCNVYGHDASFALAMKDGRFGFNVFLGGKVGKVAKSANLFLLPNEVAPFYESLLKVFKEYGFRDNRNKNRLYFLIEAVGMEKFTAALKEFSNKNYSKAGETLCKMEHFDNLQGRVELKNETFALHAIVPGGIFSGSDLITASEIAQKNGGEIRLSVEQNLYITNIKDPSTTLNHPFFKKYKNISSPYFNNLVACAGKNECSFGVIPNKPDAIELANYLTNEVPLNDTKVRFYWSGCVKGCGIHEWGDIGFVGAKAKEGGKTVFGVDILVGGSLAKAKGATTILKAVPLTTARELVKELMVEFKENKREGEHFEQFYERALEPFSKGALGFLMKFNQFLKRFELPYRFSLANYKPIGKVEALEIFEFGNGIYKALTGDKPYLEVYNFKPIGSHKPQHPSKIERRLPKEVGDIVYKMVHPKKPYEVFSEIFKEMEEKLR